MVHAKSNRNFETEKMVHAKSNSTGIKNLFETIDS